MNSDNQYEDDYYEASDLDMIHFDEEYDNDPDLKAPTPPEGLTGKKKFLKKKRRLEDWLEEKRLRDTLRDDDLDG